MLHGATLAVEVADTHHCRSPLVQGGFEIPIRVLLKMDYRPENNDAIYKYKALIEEHYSKAADDTFQDVTATVLKRLDSGTDDEVSA